MLVCSWVPLCFSCCSSCFVGWRLKGYIIFASPSAGYERCYVTSDVSSGSFGCVLPVHCCDVRGASLTEFLFSSFLRRFHRSRRVRRLRRTIGYHHNHRRDCSKVNIPNEEKAIFLTEDALSIGGGCRFRSIGGTRPESNGL